MAGVKRGGAGRRGKPSKGGGGGGGGGSRKLARPAGPKYGAAMLKLLKLAVLLGLFAGFLFLLPFGGRTLFDRWQGSRDAADFASRTWAEMRGLPPPTAPSTPGGPRRGRPGKGQAAGPGGVTGPAGAAAPGEPGPSDRPLETTTDAERKALDKLLDKHLADPPPKR
jgi:hypothetical protein